MNQRQTNRQLYGLFGWVLASAVAAALGGLASIKAATFYMQLTRSAWAPPAYVFGPVWTLLYAMMAVAAWLVWRQGGFRAARTALSLFLVQLAANALWSWLFFAWHLGAAAFIDIVLLWLLIAATLVAFWRQSKTAAALLIPYLLWVSFAMALNYSVWQLNPALLS
ncbi:MAG TPA: TspO/MBR family protein [Gammaproteobacteria bacterium]